MTKQILFLFVVLIMLGRSDENRKECIVFEGEKPKSHEPPTGSTPLNNNPSEDTTALNYQVHEMRKGCDGLPAELLSDITMGFQRKCFDIGGWCEKKVLEFTFAFDATFSLNVELKDTGIEDSSLFSRFFLYVPLVDSDFTQYFFHNDKLRWFHDTIDPHFIKNNEFILRLKLVNDTLKMYIDGKFEKDLSVTFGTTTEVLPVDATELCIWGSLTLKTVHLFLEE